MACLCDCVQECQHHAGLRRAKEAAKGDVTGPVGQQPWMNFFGLDRSQLTASSLNEPKDAESAFREALKMSVDAHYEARAKLAALLAIGISRCPTTKHHDALHKIRERFAREHAEMLWRHTDELQALADRFDPKRG